MSTKQTNNNNNKLNKIKNKTNKISKRINNIRKQVRRVRNKVRINNRRRRGTIPAASSKRMNRDFQILYQDGNTVKVTGRDLVYKIPETIKDDQGTGVITVIPANPCYWLGTRIAALAQGYQNYRPLAMKFTYIPQCAVTQQGNVIAGTLWNQAPSNDNLQQSLRTSNGGQLSQCYKGFTSVVRLKSNLQYNLYRTAGQFDQESNPFIYMAIAVGCKSGADKIIPGYFYVTWSFLLKNPIGNTNLFYNSGIQQYSYVLDNATYENKTIVYLQPTSEDIQMGAILQIEDSEIEDQINAYYNGSYYEINENDRIWYFANSTIQQTNALARSLRGHLYYAHELTPSEETFREHIMFFRESTTDPTSWSLYVWFVPQRSIPFLPGITYYYIDQDWWYIVDALQGGRLNNFYFATLSNVINDQGTYIGLRFTIPKEEVNIEILEDAMKNNNNIKNKVTTKITKLKQNKVLKTIKEELDPEVNKIPFKLVKIEKQKPHKNKQKQKQQSSNYEEDISSLFLEEQ